MTSLPPRAALIAAIASVVLLAGCTPAAQSTDTGSSTDSGSNTGTTASTGCDRFAGQTDPELALFTSSAIAAGPTEGQVYGDGTELSITLSQAAIDAGILPLFDLLTITESNNPQLISSLAFDPTTGGDGTYSTALQEFGDDELVGTAIVAEFYAISTATVDGAVQYGDKLLLGNYCMTYANDGS